MYDSCTNAFTTRFLFYVDIRLGVRGCIYTFSPLEGETQTGDIDQDSVCVVPVARRRMFGMGNVVHVWACKWLQLGKGARERSIAGGQLSSSRWCWLLWWWHVLVLARSSSINDKIKHFLRPHSRSLSSQPLHQSLQNN